VSEVLLEARGLVKRFRSHSLWRGGHETRALDSVDVDVKVGEVLAVIGESGSGKTTLGKVLLRLHDLNEGTVHFEGVDVFGLSGGALRRARRNFQMVFQNQRANLHPKMTVQQMLEESMRLHRPELTGEQRDARILELLTRVGLEARADQRPDSLSGGERRRVGLARILATKPKLIVADEPTSGLDAAIKLQIIELLKSLKEDALTYMLISHDLGLVRRIADRVVVMLKGRIIEEVPASRLGHPDHHPYTGRLLRAADLSENRQADIAAPTAEHEALLQQAEANPYAGCVYAADCPVARRRGILARCVSERPEPVALGPNHWVACFAASAAVEESR
jgi:ABC-type glutathione transport system ATPase component